MWYAQNSQWIQNSVFFWWKINFSQFIFFDKYLNFKESKCLIHYVKFGMWPALFYVNSFYMLQWNSHLDTGSFSQFILGFKLGFFNVCLRLYFDHFANSQKDWKLRFLNVAPGLLLNFLQIMKETKNCDFWVLAKAGLPNFP